MIINDIENYLNKKFPEYGFGIFFYISERTPFVNNIQSISYKKQIRVLFILMIQKIFFLK